MSKTYLLHSEFGRYLTAIGSEMVRRNVGLSEVTTPSTEEDRDALFEALRSAGIPLVDVKDVEEYAWSVMRSVTRRMFESDDAAQEFQNSGADGEDGEDDEDNLLDAETDNGYVGIR